MHRPDREAARLLRLVKRLVRRLKAGFDVVQDSADLRGVRRGLARGHQSAATQAKAELTAARSLACRLLAARAARQVLGAAGAALNGDGRCRQLVPVLVVLLWLVLV